jgi:hypothetical protein
MVVPEVLWSLRRQHDSDRVVRTTELIHPRRPLFGEHREDLRGPAESWEADQRTVRTAGVVHSLGRGQRWRVKNSDVEHGDQHSGFAGHRILDRGGCRKHSGVSDKQCRKSALATNAQNWRCLPAHPSRRCCADKGLATGAMPTSGDTGFRRTRGTAVLGAGVVGLVRAHLCTSRATAFSRQWWVQRSPSNKCRSARSAGSSCRPTVPSDGSHGRAHEASRHLAWHARHNQREGYRGSSMRSP